MLQDINLRCHLFKDRQEKADSWQSVILNIVKCIQKMNVLQLNLNFAGMSNEIEFPLA